MSRIKDVYEDAEALAVELERMSSALMLAENAAGVSSKEDIEHTFGHFRDHVDNLRVDMDMIIEGIRLLKDQNAKGVPA